MLYSYIHERSGVILKATVSVVLNVYKRSSIFQEQLEAVRKQTVKPWEILVWENGNDRVPDDLRNGLIIARASKNFGVWARFSYALNASGNFICMIDDDTIPGPRWLENCLETMRMTPGLLGTRGIIFDNKHSYSMNHDVGVYKPNEETMLVDIVGHSWFFKREWIYTFWACAEKRFQNNLAGEDIHFSYALQKILGIPTYVPKHPKNDTSLWGANPKLSKDYGSGPESISISKKSLQVFEQALNHYRKIGFKTLVESKPQTNNKHRNFLYLLVQKFPYTMHGLAKLRRALKNICNKN